MIVVLLAFLAIASVSGAVLNTDEFWGNERLELAHETLASAFYVLLPFHLLGVLVSSLFHRENLLVAMVTGRKRR